MDCGVKDALIRELTLTLRIRTALADHHGDLHPVTEIADREYHTALLMLIEHVIEHRCITGPTTFGIAS